MELEVGCASPRISFSRDFVTDAATGSLEDAAAGKRFASFDFEFAMADCSDSHRGCASTAAMLPADELISHGVLLPFEQSRCRRCSHFVTASATRHELPSPHASPSPPSLTPSRSYPSALREAASPPLSPKVPKRGAKWREFLGLKAKPDDPGAAKTSSASSSIINLFYRSRSVGSGEVDRLMIPPRPSLCSISRSPSHAFQVEQALYVGSSLPENGDCRIDHPEVCIGSWIRAGGRQANGSKMKGGCSSPGRNFPSSPGRIRSTSKTTSSVRDGDQAASNRRIVTRNSEKDDCRSSKMIHEHFTRNGRCREQWRLAHSNVRVAPVLLHVPACIAPSLRETKGTRTKLIDPHHLRPPKKPDHPKPL